MIEHHPDQNLLLEYANGSLPWAQALAVSAHIQMCPRCTQHLRQLNELGGALLDQSTASEPASDSWSRLMARVDSSEAESAAPATAEPPVAPRKISDPMLSGAPPVIRKLLHTNPPLHWQRVSRGLRAARLVTGQASSEVAFHRISCGAKVAEHDHRGQEITVVLYGSFSDADGVYSVGDFLVRQPGQVHRPTATQDQECLCLSVVEAPVAVTGLLGRLINPFLGIRPA